MNEVLPLIDDKNLFILWFDGPSLGKFLTEFCPSCISELYDKNSASGVCFQAYVQRQPNGNFESDGKLTSVENCGWMDGDDGKAHNVYGLKIYLTTSDIDGEVWKEISKEINRILGKRNEAWENFKNKIAEIKTLVLSPRVILSELNRTNEMSQELKTMIANELRSWKKLLKAKQNPAEQELQKDCVCLELKKDNNGKMYFDYQKYKNHQLRKNNDDNKWKIYLKEEYRSRATTQVIYFEKFDEVEEKNEDSTILISNSGENTQNQGVDNNYRVDNKTNNTQVKDFQRKPTTLYIFLAVVDSLLVVPLFIYLAFQFALYIILAIAFLTVILSIICISLAIWSYKFNCELEKTALQTLENNDQEAPEENQDKNTNNRIPEIDGLNKKIISTGGPSRFE